MTATAMQTLPNAEALLSNLSEQLNVHLTKNSALVGIHSGGAIILNRLLATLETTINDLDILHGTLDVSMHRDDYATRGISATIKPTKIGFDVEGKHIILIDDIFNTGRTARAAMNEIFDFGRPASITFATLVNIGGAELPISPQIVAHEMTLAADERIALSENTDGTLMLKSTAKQLQTEVDNNA